MNLTQVISFCKERQSLQSCLDATTDIWYFRMDLPLWRHPIKQGAQNICDTESCGGSSADDRTMKCPKFVVSRKETSRVQAQVMKKWMVRLKMAKRAMLTCWDCWSLTSKPFSFWLFLTSMFKVLLQPPATAQLPSTVTWVAHHFQTKAFLAMPRRMWRQPHAEIESIPRAESLLDSAPLAAHNRKLGYLLQMLRDEKIGRSHLSPYIAFIDTPIQHQSYAWGVIMYNPPMDTSNTSNTTT